MHAWMHGARMHGVGVWGHGARMGASMRGAWCMVTWCMDARCARGTARAVRACTVHAPATHARARVGLRACVGCKAVVTPPRTLPTVVILYLLWYLLRRLGLSPREPPSRDGLHCHRRPRLHEALCHLPLGCSVLTQRSAVWPRAQTAPPLRRLWPWGWWPWGCMAQRGYTAWQPLGTRCSSPNTGLQPGY